MSISVDSISEKTFDNFKKITPALVAILDLYNHEPELFE